MAISLAVLTSGSYVSGGTSTTTASFTTTANRLVLMFALANYVSGPNISPANVNGLTWVNLFDANIYVLGSNRTVGAWYAMASTGGTGTMGISFANDTNLAWDILEFAGVDTTGSNGSGAIRNYTQSFAGTGTNTATLSGASLAGNALVGFGGYFDSNAVITVGSGFTSINTFSEGSGIVAAYLAEWLNGVSQSVVDCGMTGGSQGRLFAIEVNAGGGSVPTTGAPSGLVLGAGF